MTWSLRYDEYNKNIYNIYIIIHLMDWNEHPSIAHLTQPKPIRLYIPDNNKLK